jgi:double-strand break repair protein MRE11
MSSSEDYEDPALVPPHNGEDENGEEADSANNNNNNAIDDTDDDTIRIMVSTDNHLGYAERDPVRGLDSFSALEEVLYLAKHYQADIVLLAGDLFHDNKPSRRTMHKTMQLFRKYCMGPDPVKIQILSNQAENFRQGLVNYEDEHYAVDLPVFSIHGNHDDPTRDGGELLAPLDLLSASNLVNYFGRQEEINTVKIAPVLIQKGTTNLALYGMGSMRDERLNRMWQAQHVKFLRPESSEDDDGDGGDDNGDGVAWFNLFALHQNRDLGRGTKNCVHESMIPEWMDLVVWGHEHECRIEPEESVVGTFRISQPGSSVATSLTAGEAATKQIGLLDIRGQQFRLKPIPLTQIRSFVIDEISLSANTRLDPEDPKVERKVSQALEEKVQVMIHNAREKSKENLEEAKRLGNVLVDKLQRGECPLANALVKPNEVLVRLKVEHLGFSTANNQRFGAKFIGDVANPVSLICLRCDPILVLIPSSHNCVFCIITTTTPTIRRTFSCFIAPRPSLRRRLTLLTRRKRVCSMVPLLPKNWRK